VLLAGLLPNAEVAVAVTGLSTQIQTIPWIMCYSLGTATATRVAQALGAGDGARAARLYRWAGIATLSRGQQGAHIQRRKCTSRIVLGCGPSALHACMRSC
jgi:hypothetical protein